jgi:ubiquinone/menaquinone biosynthesis C-methylase UbiE
MPYRQTIAEAYDAGVEEEYNRLTENPLREAEYHLIVELLDEYITDGSTIIDIGSGPGRYAEHLLQRNCKVGVVDLSAKSLKAFSDRIENSQFQANIIFNQVSCATQLDWIASNSADAILLMGPLYHLIDEEHRTVALSHCHRILKPGGYLFSVFLSRFPVSTPQTVKTPKDLFSENHPITHTSFKGFQVPQFRCWPNEAKKIMSDNNFKTLRIRNIEGTASFLPDSHWEGSWPEQKKKELLHSLLETCEKPDLLGITHQYVCIGMAEFA